MLKIIQILLFIHNKYSKKQRINISIKKKFNNDEIHKIINEIKVQSPKLIEINISLGTIANNFIGKEIIIHIDGLDDKNKENIDFLNNLKIKYEKPREIVGNLKIIFFNHNNKIKNYIKYNELLNFDKMR